MSKANLKIIIVLITILNLNLGNAQILTLSDIPEIDSVLCQKINNTSLGWFHSEKININNILIYSLIGSKPTNKKIVRKKTKYTIEIFFENKKMVLQLNHRYIMDEQNGLAFRLKGRKRLMKYLKSIYDQHLLFRVNLT